jgi:BspA type Leucine rich repeat region (6 copies)
VTIPNSVTSIGCRAFSGCSGLKKVIIPNSVTRIGMNAFVNCNNLQLIIIDADNRDAYKTTIILLPALLQRFARSSINLKTVQENQTTHSVSFWAYIWKCICDFAHWLIEKLSSITQAFSFTY